jgi:hypothetical protein
MKFGRLMLLLACFTLFGCPEPAPFAPEDAVDGGPCSEGSQTTLAAGSWTGSSFDALENGESTTIEFGSQGGIMAAFDLLATGVGSSAKDLKIEFRSLDGSQSYTSNTFNSVNFACQNSAGQVLVDMTVEVDSVPRDESVILYLEASFEVENGDPVLLQSSTEIILTL